MKKTRIQKIQQFFAKENLKTINLPVVVAFCTIAIMGYLFINQLGSRYYDFIENFKHQFNQTLAATETVSRMCRLKGEMPYTDSIKKSILDANIAIAQPLAEIRVTYHAFYESIMDKNLFHTINPMIKKISDQHEYILIHEACPLNVLPPRELEKWKNEILPQFPQSLISASFSLFKSMIFDKKREPLDSNKQGCLFALGMSNKVKLTLSTRNDVPESATRPVLELIAAIRQDHHNNNGKSCKIHSDNLLTEMQQLVQAYPGKKE